MRGSDEVQVPASSRREMYMRGRQAGIRETLEALSKTGGIIMRGELYLVRSKEDNSDTPIISIDSLIKYLELGGE